eukprot:1583034-Prymnesium_polylepis.1
MKTSLKISKKVLFSPQLNVPWRSRCDPLSGRGQDGQMRGVLQKARDSDTSPTENSKRSHRRISWYNLTWWCLASAFQLSGPRGRPVTDGRSTPSVENEHATAACRAQPRAPARQARGAKDERERATRVSC